MAAKSRKAKTARARNTEQEIQKTGMSNERQARSYQLVSERHNFSHWWSQTLSSASATFQNVSKNRHTFLVKLHVDAECLRGDERQDALL